MTEYDEQFNGELAIANKLIRAASRKAREAGLKYPRYIYIPKHNEYSSLIGMLGIDYNLVPVFYNKDEIIITEEKLKDV